MRLPIVRVGAIDTAGVRLLPGFRLACPDGPYVGVIALTPTNRLGFNPKPSHAGRVQIKNASWLDEGVAGMREGLAKYREESEETSPQAEGFSERFRSLHQLLDADAAKRC